MSQTVHHRSLAGARMAFNHDDVAVARQLSRDAHSLISPSSPRGNGTVMELGHNEESEHAGLNLVLRGAVDGIILSTILVSFVDAAGWTSTFSPQCGIYVVGAWALFLSSREALEVVTYRAHYEREARREKWGAPRAAHRAALVPPSPPHPHLLGPSPQCSPGCLCPLQSVGARRRVWGEGCASTACAPYAELDNYPDGEVAEMIQLYVKKGLKEETAKAVVEGMATDSDFFVDVMMLVRRVL